MSPRTVLSVGLLTAVFGLAGAAEAQISRVFVSVNGNDANNCASQATPCRTIGGGIAQVDAGGEVIIVDTGSYAGGSITKAVKVTAAPGVVAFSGLPFQINPGAGKTVVLRGLTIKSTIPGSGQGIVHSTGNLMIEECIVDGWTTGINVQSPGNLSIRNSTFRNNTNGGDGQGVNIQAGVANLSNVHIANNFFGVVLEGGVVTVSDSVIVQNNTGLRRNAGTLSSLGNNVIEGNTTNTFGTITAGTLK